MSDFYNEFDVPLELVNLEMLSSKRGQWGVGKSLTSMG